MKHLHTTLFVAALCSAATLSGQWQPLNSGQGSIRSITTQGATIHMASYPNGVFTSTNGGSTWAASNSGLPLTNSSYFVRSVGRNATHLFAGTHTGIYRSANGGTSWTVANGSLTATNMVYANKFFQFGNTTFAVFTGTIANGGGMYRTVDNGNTWLIGHSGLGSNATVYHIATSGSALYAATSVGLYKSTDNGQQWALLPASNFSIFAVEAVNGRLIIVSTFGYRYSTNDGATWINSTGGVANPTRGELIAFDGDLYSISGTSAGCLISTDNGTSYSAFNTGLSPIDAVSQEQFHVAGQRLYMGTFSDIYSLDGSTVSLAEHNSPSYVPIYPNPFLDGFTIDLSAQVGSQDVIMLDPSGREVRRIGGLQAGKHFMPRDGLASGLYTLLRIEEQSGAHIQLGSLVAE